uniref:Uncharacterized protein LOC100178487 n=1 Tax=Phallusia mammillata TaxID=59560 RepID=A0A6F9DG45_9ASCI|nr:uncharacterized protein LOC100178487 [Phallusia mammillata]
MFPNRRSMPPRSFSPDFLYAEGRRKSFEAEDGPSVLRSMSAPQDQFLPYGMSKQIPQRAIYNSTGGLPLITEPLTGMRFDSEASLIQSDVQGMFIRPASNSLPRCISDSSVRSMPIPRSSSEVKRNHSLKNFLQRKIQPSVRRSKSTKLTSGKENYPVVDVMSLMAQGGPSRSVDVELPFFMPSIESPDVIDLTEESSDFENAAVRALHHSILGRNYCFEIVTSKGTRCFGCNSSGEREAWIEKIRRAINPNLDNCHRMEHQLTLFVQEAKGLPAKKKYFCEICLDRKLCARTTSKWKNDSTVFWGEQFQFSSIPKMDDITVHLYKDSDKKKKKDKDYIGLVNLSVRSLVNQQLLEKWYTLSTPSGNNKNKAGESLAVRIKVRFQSIHVLPTEQYKDFAEHMSMNYKSICNTLSNVLAVSKKDEIARILVNIMYATGSIKDYMCDIVMGEVEKVEEESLIFRENTIGTKSVEAFLRLVGMKYLHDALGDFIQAIFTMEEECEVDGSRLPPHAHLESNQKNLQMSCEIALCKITSSIGNFPSELREVLSIWRTRCEDAGRPRIANRLVTASLFLRLLCPSILNPSLFGLANEVPDPKTSRTLTLIAKVIQNLANRSRFGTKEEYMQFMDAFIRDKWDVMGEFISNVSDHAYPALKRGFEGYIDLGKEFAKLHAFFVEVLPGLNENIIQSLGELPEIISKISKSLESPCTAPALRPSGSRLRCVSTEPSCDLTQIDEDFQPATASVSIHAECSQSSVGASNRSPPTASSLLDLRHLVSVHDDSACDDLGVANGFSPSHHGSHSSVALSSSFNNSNNNTSNPRTRQTLLSMENLEKRNRSQDSSPLMFSNPAYRVKSQSAASPLTSKRKSSSDCARGPLAFTNPLQTIPSSKSHRLETVFTTETVTYSAPSHLPIVNYPRHSKIDPQTSFGSDSSKESVSDEDSHSTSLSSRQSSTTTGDDSAVSSIDFTAPQNINHITTSRDQPEEYPVSAQKVFIPELEEDSLMTTACNVPMSVSNANLRTGLQSQPSGRKPGNQTRAIQPQPKPRLSVGIFGDSKKATHSVTVSNPNVDEQFQNKSVVVSSPGPSNQSASLQLTQEPGAFLELNAGPDEDCEGLVTAPVAAVKSRTVVRTSNATRMKTSKHTSSLQQQIQTFSQETRRNSQKKVTAVVQKYQRTDDLPAEKSMLPPATPEDPISPEARTAQWILSNVPHSNKDSKRSDVADMHTVLTPKDYEDRIIRLETEVEQLRSVIKDKMEMHRSLEHKNSALLEKVQKLQQSEDKIRQDYDQKEKKCRELSQRIRDNETKQRSEMVDNRVLLESKDKALSDTRVRMDKLRKENNRLMEAVAHLQVSVSTNRGETRPLHHFNPTQNDALKEEKVSLVHNRPQLSHRGIYNGVTAEKVQHGSKDKPSSSST